MSRKNYWKELCFLLIGLILGCMYQNHFRSLPIKHETLMIKKDTIVTHDTIYAKAIVPPLSRKSVLAELHKQKVPHPRIVLAQSVLETGNYTSAITKTHNNIFGLRKGNRYRKYDNYVECIADYKRLISSRYKGGDYYQFLNNLGYAENPNYISMLKDLV